VFCSLSDVNVLCNPVGSATMVLSLKCSRIALSSTVQYTTSDGFYIAFQ